jgi:siroheme synthase-like protein
MTEPFLAGLLVDGRRCVVVGGNREAADKAARLVDAGARVRVVAERVEPALAQMAATGALEWCARAVRDEDLEGAFLVVSTPRDEELSARLYARACAPGGFLLCCVDQPAWCTFTNVAVVRRGPLQIGIASGGGAPMLAARIRRALEEQLGHDLSAFAARLAALRAATPPAKRRAVMSRALEGFAWVLSYAIPDPRDADGTNTDESERALPDE